MFESADVLSKETYILSKEAGFHQKSHIFYQNQKRPMFYQKRPRFRIPSILLRLVLDSSFGGEFWTALQTKVSGIHVLFYTTSATEVVLVAERI